MSSCCSRIIVASGTITACECAGPGDCPRHGCKKPPHFFNLCKNDPRYFAKWENGEGPGQIKPEPNPLPLGTWVASAIKFATLGKVSPCTGCKSRAAALDRFGARVANAWRKYVA